MSTQQDIYATGSKNSPPMLNIENYVPWSSRLLSAAEIKRWKQMIKLFRPFFSVFPKTIYAAVDSCETAQEIWLRVQQMMKGSDIGIQEKKAKLFNEWERSTTAMNMALALMAKAFQTNNYSTPTQQQPCEFHQTLVIADCSTGYEYGSGQSVQWWSYGGIPSSTVFAGQNVGYQNGYNAVQNVGNQVVQDAVPDQERHQSDQEEGMLLSSDSVVDCSKRKEEGIHLQAEEFDLMADAADLDEIVGDNAKLHFDGKLADGIDMGTQMDNAPVYDSDGSSEILCYAHKHWNWKLSVLEAVVSQELGLLCKNQAVVDSSNLQTELDRTKERLEN
ncbi:hypothetical protein Tco_0410798 [Tanacetum coccineum]